MNTLFSRHVPCRVDLIHVNMLVYSPFWQKVTRSKAAVYMGVGVRVRMPVAFTESLWEVS